MGIDLHNLRILTAKLRENLAKCGHDPDEEAVHDTRTGTRRIEAALETLLREAAPAEGDALYDAVHSWLRLLKKVRRAAAPVRDLDVHRKLLEKLVKPEKHKDSQESGQTGEAVGPDEEAPPSRLVQQADDLDAWLKQRRQHHTSALKKKAAGWAEKLEKRLAVLETALAERPVTRRRAKRPAAVALDSFAIVASHIQLLDAVNLHDFRKGAKKARYVAESGGEDESAKLVGGALKKLQDAIGDWHDWLVLAEEAHGALGHEAAELMARLEAERDGHYASAMKMAARLRGRLMGEWQSRAPARRVTRSARNAGSEQSV